MEVVDSDAHEAKLSIAAIPSRKINIFIDEFPLAEGFGATAADRCIWPELFSAILDAIL